MKGFWKWFFIVLGILVVIGLVFAVALFFFRGSGAVVRPVGPGQRLGVVNRGYYGMGGLMFGMGILMFLRFVIPLGILVLAGFGIAYLASNGRKPAAVQPVSQKTCAHCGKPLAADWTTCPYCGAPVQSAAPVPPVPPEQTPPQA